ncbi:MAG: glycoside hydrolase family 38 C-terminal domain-containing protein [Anaerohalosphaeraceae bacterium]
MAEKSAINGDRKTARQSEGQVSNKSLIQCHFISNTHWDREWRFSMQRTRSMLVYMMDMLLDIFEKEPQYQSFHLDSQTIPLQDYLEIRPERKEQLQALISAKKLLVGPWFCLPDEFSVGGESLVRNLLLGHKIARSFGHVSKTGYSPFSWGQISQMPQIYDGFGIRFAAFYRGVNTDVAPHSEYIWQGADGTRIVTSRLAARPRYNVWYVIQRPVYWNIKDINNRVIPWGCGFGPFKFIGSRYQEQDAQYSRPKFIYQSSAIPASARRAIEEQNGDWTTPHRFWSCGHDSSCPDIREVQMIRDCSRTLQDTAEVFHSTFEDFQKQVLESVHHTLPVRYGEMRYYSDSPSTSPLFGWIISARMDLKMDNFRTERELTQYAEPLAVFASLLGASYPQGFLDQAYHWLLQNHGHDSIGGCSRDIVGQDMLFRSRQSREIASCVAERALMDIAGTIDYSTHTAEDMVILVYNPAPFKRNDVVTLHLELPREWEAGDFELLDENGGKVEIQSHGGSPSFQIVQSPNDTANMFLTCRYRTRAVLKNIPALGYTLYFVRPLVKKTPPRPSTMITVPDTMENEYLRVMVHANGTLTIIDKQTGQRYEQMGYFRDTSEVGSPWQHEEVENNAVFTTLGQTAEVSLMGDYGLEASYRVRFDWLLPAGRSDEAKSRSAVMRPVSIVGIITLRKGQRWVEIETEVTNTVEDHYLQVVFPCQIKADAVDVQGQFDVIHRTVRMPYSTTYTEPPQTEQPMNSFVDISDGVYGVALLNEGLKAYHATDEERPELRLTLLRAFPLRICVTQEMIDYSRIDKSSQCLGTHRFRYAVMPHAGRWDAADVWKAAEQFNQPLVIAQTAPTDAGTEPVRKSFLEVLPDTLHVSAVKRSENGNGWIVRLFNPFSRLVCAEIRLNGGYAQPSQTDSPVQRQQKDMALPGTGRKLWQAVRLVTLEECEVRALSLDAAGWCRSEIPPRKIVTLEFLA